MNTTQTFNRNKDYKLNTCTLKLGSANTGHYLSADINSYTLNDTVKPS